ncbi:hypothetical protein LG634_09435 [Streptomyces bambusae]|uniref:hypothetical protein n=1 Tax=Streptomyces bambusae TaxID=1550616 RepID=UPI001CFD21EE|nr:hypothetical protein [Streptomyces bambusae]MCB5165049.1 hypothetical protein [Streptomyces bambusae]
MRYFGFYDATGYRIGSRTRAADLPRGPVAGDRSAPARYMADCEILTVAMGVEPDPFDESHLVMGAFSVYTDGTWCWPGMAARLVVAHGLAVPADFAEHAARAGHAAPRIRHDELVRLFLEIKDELLPG